VPRTGAGAVRGVRETSSRASRGSRLAGGSGTAYANGEVVRRRRLVPSKPPIGRPARSTLEVSGISEGSPSATDQATPDLVHPASTDHPQPRPARKEPRDEQDEQRRGALRTPCEGEGSRVSGANRSPVRGRRLRNRPVHLQLGDHLLAALLADAPPRARTPLDAPSARQGPIHRCVTDAPTSRGRERFPGRRRATHPPPPRRSTRTTPRRRRSPGSPPTAGTAR